MALCGVLCLRLRYLSRELLSALLAALALLASASRGKLELAAGRSARRRFLLLSYVIGVWHDGL